MSERPERKLAIRTKRLLLRPMTEEDTAAGLAILMNETIAGTYMLPDFTSREEAEEMYLRLMRMSASPERVMYGMDMGGRIIGWIHAVEDTAGQMEVGYAVHPDWQGRGCATEALEAVIEELRRMGYSRVIAGYFEENRASRRVMEKCGMKDAGRTEEIEYRGSVRKCRYMEIGPHE